MTDNHFSRRLANRYGLMDVIGKGSMGTVYAAKDILLGVPVAVKFLAHALLNEQMTQRFLHEAMTCAQLGNKSIHVVRVTDYGVTEDEIPFYVMEYLKGNNLSQILEPRPLPVKRFRDFIRQICLGLEAAHKGIILNDQVVPIIHRDIKPSNILVTQSASVGELVKILDLGIAKLMQAGRDEIEQPTQTFLGTLAYASPEQMEGQELDNRSDIYSLGIMMYQMLTGSLPLRPTKVDSFGAWYKAHRTQSPIPLNGLSPYGPLPKPLKDVVMSCLAKDPSQRPHSVSQLLNHLEGVTRPAPLLPQISEEERFYRRQVWPHQEKPIAEIVFPRLLAMDHRQLPTLWVMLSSQEIEQRLRHTGYNNFLFTLSPHPMVLWITAFYSKAQGPRWLSSYLDLKKSDNQKLIWYLAEDGSYRILFFPKHHPTKGGSIQCADFRRLHIAAAQRKLLKDWVLQARQRISFGTPQAIKSMLRKEFNQKLKPNMMW